jgi:hypothetical protein
MFCAQTCNRISPPNCQYCAKASVEFSLLLFAISDLLEEFSTCLSKNKGTSVDYNQDINLEI